MALAEHRSFTRAAVQCHLSQPAFSALIKALEDALGARLFDRSTRRVDLTPRGELSRIGPPHSRRDARRRGGLRDAVTLQRGRVAVALLPSLAAGWLPQVLASYQQAHPALRWTLPMCCRSPALTAWPAARPTLPWPPSAPTPALQAEPFCSDGFHLVCPSSTRWRGAESRWPWPIWRDYPFIHLARHSSVRQYLEAAFRPQAMRTLMEVEQLATVTGMVRAGLGISVVPALTLFHFQQPGWSRPLHCRG